MVIEDRLRDVVYGAGGVLLGGTLVEDLVIDGVPCQGGEIVELHEDGRLQCARLASDTVVGGIPCAGGADVEFYPSGSLRWARLARPHLIGSVPCAAVQTPHLWSVHAATGCRPVRCSAWTASCPRLGDRYADGGIGLGGNVAQAGGVAARG
jgi:hypothetical protein